MKFVSQVKESMNKLLNLIKQNHIEDLTLVEIFRLESPLVDISDQNQATIGVIRVDGETMGFTLEPPDRENKKDSSIPLGTYVCEQYSSKKYPTTYCVKNVKDRTYILFHAGNVDKNTLGCILLGTSIGYLSGQRAVLSSKVAFNKFKKKLKNVKKFVLKISKV